MQTRHLVIAVAVAWPTAVASCSPSEDAPTSIDAALPDTSSTTGEGGGLADAAPPPSDASDSGVLVPPDGSACRITDAGADVGACALARDASTALPWHKTFGGANDDWFYRPYLDRAGNIVVAGVTRGGIDLGGGVLASATAFVAKFDPGGGYLWAQPFTTTPGDADTTTFGYNTTGLGAIALDRDDGVIVVGNVIGTTVVAGRTLTGNGDPYIAKLTACGDLAWVQQFPKAPFAAPTIATTDAAGNIIVSGNITGPADFGGGPLSPPPIRGPLNIAIFVLKVDACGSHLASAVFGPEGEMLPWGLVTDSTGAVIVAGGVSSASDVHPDASPISKQGPAAYILKLDPSLGYVFAREYAQRAADDSGIGGGFYLDQLRDVTIDAQDAIYMVGRFNGTVDYGCGPLSSNLSYDGLALKLTKDGDCVWSRQVAHDNGSVALDDTGNVYVSTSIGTQTIGFSGVTKLDPQGYVLSDRPSSGAVTLQLAPRTGGRVLVAGYFTATVTLPDGSQISSAGGKDAVIEALNP